jgi:hypothetical protein
VVAGFGRFDVIVGVDAPSRGALVDAIERLRSLPEVREVEVWQHMAVVKESYAADLAAAARAAAAPA